MSDMVQKQTDYLADNFPLDELISRYADATERAFCAQQLALRYKQALAVKVKREGKKEKIRDDERSVLRSAIYSIPVVLRRTVWSQADYNAAFDEVIEQFRKKGDMAAVQLMNICLDRHTKSRVRTFLNL